MEQAPNYVCGQCANAVPSGHKFCGACGADVPADVQTMRSDYFGSLQIPGRARLVVVYSDSGMTEGLSYMLSASEHVVGRQTDQIAFPHDRWMSPQHANFLYRGSQLAVRDEASLNGVFVRVRRSERLEFGDMFMCGDQVFRIDPTPPDSAGPDRDETYFYASPKRSSAFRVVQVLTGGADGNVCAAREGAVSIGRENCDMNFHDDRHMSPTHARVESSGNAMEVVDLQSQNGVYVRIRGEKELVHGDYVFVGRELMRVEITA